MLFGTTDWMCDELQGLESGRPQQSVETLSVVCRVDRPTIPLGDSITVLVRVTKPRREGIANQCHQAVAQWRRLSRIVSSGHRLAYEGGR